MNIWFAVLIALVAAVLVGWVNGQMVMRTRLP